MRTLAPPGPSGQTPPMPRNKLNKVWEKVAREKGLLGDATMPRVNPSPRPLPPVSPTPPDFLLSATFFAPVRIESEMNLREHWASRKRRYDEQEVLVNAVLKKASAFAEAVGRWVRDHNGRIRVRFTRHGKRQLDDDNLQSGFKHTRDLVAAWIGIDDGHPVWKWDYDQTTGGEYRVVIYISTEVA